MNFIYAVLLLPCIFLCAEISSKEMEGFEHFESKYFIPHIRSVRQLKYERDIFNNGKTKVSGNVGLKGVTPPQGHIGIKVHHDVNKKVYIFGQGEVTGQYKDGKIRHTGSSGHVGGFESQYDYSASHVRKVRQLKYERDIYNNGKTKVSGNIGINSVTPPQGQIGIKVHHDVNKRVYVFGQGEVSGGFNGSKFRYTGSSGQVGIGIRF